MLGALVAGTTFAQATMEHFCLRILGLNLGVSLEHLTEHLPISKGFLPGGLDTMHTVLDLSQQWHNTLLELPTAHVAMTVLKETNTCIRGG